MLQKVKYLILGCCLLGSTLGIAQSQKQQQLEKKRAALQQEMRQLQQLRDSNKKQEISILGQVEDLDDKIRLRENLIKVTNRQANLLTQEIDENLNKISSLREELAMLKEDYAQMIQKAYKSKSGQSRIMFLLSSESFKQALKRVQYMKQYAQYRKKQGEQIKDRTLLLQKLNQDLIEQKTTKEALVAENRKAKQVLDREKAQQKELVQLIRQKESSYATQIKNKQREASRIDSQIDAIIAAAIAANNKKSGNTSKKGNATTFALTPAAKALAANFTANKGKLPWPVDRGRIIKRFGRSQHPTLPNIITYNSGVEIQTEPGAFAKAAFKGEVTTIQKIKGANYIISIRHGNYLTLYQNLIKLKVKTGDKVDTGEVLGEIARDGFNGKTILKFLVVEDTKRLNPADWVLNM